MYQLLRLAVRRYIKFIYKIKIIGKKNIPKKGSAAILCSNHEGYGEPCIISCCYLPRLYFLAKAELFKFKPFGAILKTLGAIPLQRSKADVGALKKGLDKLKSGGKLVIFPQGHRFKEFDPKSGKRGAAKLAIKADCPIIPISICRQRTFLFKKIFCFIGEPIYSEGRDERELMDVVMQKIADGLNDFYGEKTPVVSSS